MNVFVLDTNPMRCAQYHCDKHVVKMLLEYTQLMWTYLINKYGDKPIEEANSFGVQAYKPTHINHPCNVWLREDQHNYLWLYYLWLSLHEEYELRYDKTHATFKFYEVFTKYAEHYRNIWNINLPADETELEPNEAKLILDLTTGEFIKNMTPFKLAMPDEYKCGDAVESYRRYYRGAKSYFAKWKTEVPDWFNKTEEVV